MQTRRELPEKIIITFQNLYKLIDACLMDNQFLTPGHPCFLVVSMSVKTKLQFSHHYLLHPPAVLPEGPIILAPQTTPFLMLNDWGWRGPREITGSQRGEVLLGSLYDLQV